MRVAYLHPDSVWQVILSLLLEYGPFVLAAVVALTIVYWLLKLFFRGGKRRG